MSECGIPRLMCPKVELHNKVNHPHAHTHTLMNLLLYHESAANQGSH